MLSKTLSAPLSASITLWMLCACSSFGPGRIVADQFDYNEAIASSSNQQMLLNLVRLRYSEIPQFLAVNSVLTQYIYAGSFGLDGSGGASVGFDQYLGGGAAAVRYVERPTITYTPLSGQEFATQLITPVPTEFVFSLVQSGWPAEDLLAMTIQRINDLPNLPFALGATPEQQDRLRRFRRTMELFVELAIRHAVEAQESEEEDGARLLVFDDGRDSETQEMIDEMKDALGLSREISVFRMTTDIIGREPDEVTVRIRSVLELMGFLALGVEVPPEHVEENRASPSLDTAAEGARPLVPLRVRFLAEPPVDAFVAVRHGDHWFYIPHSDQQSKQSFGLLAYLFQMQAPKLQGAGPLLTVTTG